MALNWFKKEKAIGSVATKSLDTAQVLFEGSPFFLSLKNCSSALMGYQNKIVYAVTNVLVTKLLEVPILVSTDRDVKQAKHFRQSKALNAERLYIAKALGITEKPDHPLNELLDAPNQYQTGIELMGAFWFNRILSGYAVMWVERKGDLSRRGGQPVALHVIPSYQIQIVESGDWKDPIKEFRFTGSGADVILKKEDVLYSAAWNPNSTFKGYNPFDTIGNTVDKNNLNDLAQMAAFKNGGTGILFSSDTVTDGVGGVDDKMTPEQMAQLKQTIMNEYAGAHNNKRMHFTNGFVNVTNFGDTLADLKLIEASETEVKEICAVFGVSPILIGEGKSNTESNVVQAYKSLVTNNVVPKLREFDQAFNKFSKNWYKGETVKIAHDITEFAELMPNMELVKKVYGDNAAVILNEYRLMLGLSERPEEIFKKSYIQSGFVPLEDAGFTNSYSVTQNNNNG